MISDKREQVSLNILGLICGNTEVGLDEIRHNVDLIFDGVKEEIYKRENFNGKKTTENKEANKEQSE